jgi:hypothetical protein
MPGTGYSAVSGPKALGDAGPHTGFFRSGFSFQKPTHERKRETRKHRKTSEGRRSEKLSANKTENEVCYRICFREAKLNWGPLLGEYSS